MEELINKAKEYVSQLYREQPSEKFLYHNFEHALEVMTNVEEIGINSGLDFHELSLIKLAAIFHDTGWIIDADNHETKSSEIAKDFLASNGLNQADISKVVDLICITDLKTMPKTILQMVLRDGDILHIGKKGFYKRSQLLRAEKKIFKDKIFTELEWVESNIDFLIANKFFTEYANNNYETKRQQNISKLNNKRDEMMAKNINTTDQSENNPDKIPEKKKDKNTGRGVETMFRNTIRTHVEFSSMADSKANIMISVNTLILTAVAAFLVKSLDTNPHLILPTIILVISSLSTLVYAISVTKPKITSGLFSKDDVEKRNVNLMFFGNFCNMDLKTFEWGMNELIKDSEFLYSNMIKDYYYLGKVLGEKYKKLRITYSIFMYGIIISFIVFGLAIFLSSRQTIINP
ncbi:MAG: HD domain-containing protein [Ignavibacteriales bacterium]|nr:HD domain-containing protein [Ignavibacteriales bacterium]